MWAKQNNTPNCNCSTSQLNREVKRNSDWKSNGIACISISDAFMSPFVPSEQIFVVHILFFSPLFFSTTSSEICESYHKYFTLFRYFHGFFYRRKTKIQSAIGFPLLCARLYGQWMWHQIEIESPFCEVLSIRCFNLPFNISAYLCCFHVAVVVVKLSIR